MTRFSPGLVLKARGVETEDIAGAGRRSPDRVGRGLDQQTDVVTHLRATGIGAEEIPDDDLVGNPWI